MEGVVEKRLFVQEGTGVTCPGDDQNSEKTGIMIKWEWIYTNKTSGEELIVRFIIMKI